MQNVRLLIVGAVGFVLFCPTSMYAWGCEGHQVVAYIAEHEMNPAALSAANALLTAFPIEDHRNCTVSPGTTPLSDAATWADDIRFKRKDTAPWHFIDVPLNQAGANPRQWCESTGCVLSAIDDHIKVLQKDTNSLEAAEALRFIIHFVGDVHQPLHAITNTDRGGNCVPLFFDHRPRLSRGSYSPELHGIWDTEMVVELTDKSNVDDAQSLAKLLDTEITTQERAAWTNGSIDQWAIESSRFAASNGYGGLMGSGGRAVSPSDIAGSEVGGKCDLSREQNIVAMQITPGADYRDAAESVIELRFKQAGVRLAKVLNEIWPDSSAPVHNRALHKRR